jgi:hypothetical protein
MSLGKYLLSGATVVLAVISVSVIWQLLTADYPTHSDVFFMGVEAGALVVVLLVCLSLMSFLLYRIVTIPKKKKNRFTSNSWRVRLLGSGPSDPSI